MNTAWAVAAVPTVSDGAAVLWTAQAGGVRLTQLNSAGARIADDIAFAGASSHALTVTPRGFAALVRRVPGNNLTDEMWLIEVTAAGAVLLETRIVGGNDSTIIGSEWVDAFYRRARIVWDGTVFWTYFTIQRRWPDNIAHQGDTLRSYDANGTNLGGGWGWGCSHSLDVRMTHNGTQLGPVCLSDCYPTKGIHFAHRTTEISPEPSGDCAGSSTARLGGLAPVTDGFWFTFTSTEGRASADVALVHIDNSDVVDQRLWLTANATAESSAKLALFGTEMLTAWRDGASHILQRLGADGTPTGTSEIVSTIRFSDKDDFFTFSSGDAGWVWAWDALGELKLVRVRRCM